jgi:hypothetical protein
VLLQIRHTKEGIPEIPKPIKRLQLLRMSRLEANTYNTLVSLAQANLISTGLEGGTHRPGPEHPDSLLNPSPDGRKSAYVVMQNIRLACCGGGKQVLSLRQKDIDETILLAAKFGGDAERVAGVRTFLNRCLAGEHSQCASCGVWLPILMINPCCTSLCCVSCLRGRNNHCPVCLQYFDVDQFQLLQVRSGQATEAEWPPPTHTTSCTVPLFSHFSRVRVGASSPACT